MNRTEIAPGVYLTALPGEKFKRCLLQVSLLVPGTREQATALALLPHLLERRCRAIPDPVLLSRRLSGLYGAEISSESYTAGSARVVTLGISGLKNAYALDGEDLAGEYLTLLCELLFAPKMTGGLLEAEDIAIEKEKQAEFLRSEMNDKRVRCLRQGRRKLFGASPLGLESAGYLEDMEAVTPESVTAAYRALLRQARVEVVVCGADPAPLAKTLAARFEELERDTAAFSVRGAPPPAPLQRYTEPLDTAQGKLCILCTAGRVEDVRSAAALQVASALLGGLPSSRLFLNVREKQGLCYYCTSSYSPLTNVISIDSGVDHANAERAAAAMLQELAGMQAEPVREEEMEFAKLALQNSFAAARDNPDVLVNWVLGQQLRGSVQTLEEAAALVDSITREEVRDALAAYRPTVEYVITGKGDA